MAGASVLNFRSVGTGEAYVLPLAFSPTQHRSDAEYGYLDDNRQPKHWHGVVKVGDDGYERHPNRERSDQHPP